MKPPAQFEHEPRPGLSPPKYGLRALLAAMALICLLLAVGRAFGMQYAAALLLAAGVVFAHVAGNAIGVKLRRSSARAMRRAPQQGAERAELGSHSTAVAPGMAHQSAAARPICPPANSVLSQRSKVGWLVAIATAFGAVAGAGIGGGLLARLHWDEITWTSLACALLFCGVLGGLAGFLASSFVRVAAHALWRAD